MNLVIGKKLAIIDRKQVFLCLSYYFVAAYRGNEVMYIFFFFFIFLMDAPTETKHASKINVQ